MARICFFFLLFDKRKRQERTRERKEKAKERDTNRVGYILSLIQLAVAIDENQ
jgi:hypothetical protein